MKKSGTTKIKSQTNIYSWTKKKLHTVNLSYNFSYKDPMNMSESVQNPTQLFFSIHSCTSKRTSHKHAKQKLKPENFIEAAYRLNIWEENF